jgi:ABC-2 type transport system ATP-binding protein
VNEPAQAPAVHADGVGRSFDDVEAVREVSLSVPTGAIVGLIGPSGAGKTTLIRMIVGALVPSRGTVAVLGEDPRHFTRATRERIGYLPQVFTLYPDLTAGENVSFMGSIHGLLWRRRRRRVRETLDLVDLLGVRNRRAGQLSGGMQRRLELAAALVHEPDLLILDEPTGGIDPVLRARIWDELHRLRDAGRTLLVTTQYVNEAEECDQVAVLSAGYLVAFDQPQALLRAAMGGQAAEIETREPFAVDVLEDLEPVSHLEQIGPRTFRVIAEDVGVATPAVLEAVEAAGGSVTAAREYTPSFDEAFASLIEARATA